MYQDYILEDLEEYIAKRVRKLENVIEERQSLEAWISAILTLGALGSVALVYLRVQRYLGKGFSVSRSSNVGFSGGD